jgi:CBS domain-containing protein
MSNADRFLDAFNTIEQELYRMLELGQHRRFYELVKLASRINPVIERYKSDLLEYGDLRNAIVHTRTDGRVIAEPNDQTVAEIEHIASYLLEPPRVVPLFRREVVTMNAADPAGKAVKFMYRRGYSQIPIKDGPAVTALLTAGTVVRWLADCLDRDGFNPRETAIAAVLKYTEHPHNFKFVDTATSLFQVQDLFYQYGHGGKKLEAVLITDNADPAEPLLGIITIWDLPLVQRELA